MSYFVTFFLQKSVIGEGIVNNVVFLGEYTTQSVFMFIHPAREMVRHAAINYSVMRIGHHVNTILSANRHIK